MKTLLKYSIVIAFTIFCLSLTVDQKPIFGYVYKWISPLTRGIQGTTEDFFKKSVNSTSDYSRKIFDNSVPKLKDTVRSKMSSTKAASEPLDKVTPEDRAQLDDLIKSHK